MVRHVKDLPLKVQGFIHRLVNILLAVLNAPRSNGLVEVFATQLIIL